MAGEDGAIDFERLTSLIERKQAAVRRTGAPKSELVTDASTPSEETIEHQARPHLRSDETCDRKVVFMITGVVADRTEHAFVIDWYGGRKLTIDRANAFGDWEQLEPGQWIEATVLRRMSGEVVQAMLIGTVDEPLGFSEEELTASYSTIPAAKLDPVE